MKKIILFFYCFLVALPFSAFSHSSAHSEKEINTALSIFEQATLLSPELLERAQKSSVVPYYKVNGQKIYLDQGFWHLTKAWIRIYIEEIEKHCACDLNPDLMIQSAKNYIPQGFFEQKVFNPGKEKSKEISYQGSYLTAKYGYTIAALKLSAEVAETLLSVFVGGKGIHVLCNAIDVMIFPLARKIQKYIRVFSYSQQMGQNPLTASMKMAWLFRQVKKSQKRVFFHIEQAIEYRAMRLNQINAEGPRSLFHQRGHRLLWIERLHEKTNLLFDEIIDLEEKLDHPNTKPKEKRQIERQIKRVKRKIEQVSQVNRKDFFGTRFKRFLLLKSRKGRLTYMSGKGLTNEIAGRDILWPLSLQENVMERVLSFKLQNTKIDTSPDEIQDGLIEEFLSRKNQEDLVYDREAHEESIRFFLQDVERVFDTTKKQAERLMGVSSIENVLGILFAYHLKVLTPVLSHKYKMSFMDQMKLRWIFGRFSNSVYSFSDFLSSVAIIKDETKIQFYKYESMEKLLAFFHYLYMAQQVSKTENSKTAFFEKINEQGRHLKSLSLLQEKKTSFSLVPFRSKPAECKKLIRKYQ